MKSSTFKMFGNLPTEPRGMPEKDEIENTYISPKIKKNWEEESNINIISSSSSSKKIIEAPTKTKTSVYNSGRDPRSPKLAKPENMIKT